jgi:hypothetical protein
MVIESILEETILVKRAWKCSWRGLYHTYHQHIITSNRRRPVHRSLDIIYRRTKINATNQSNDCGVELPLRVVVLYLCVSLLPGLCAKPSLHCSHVHRQISSRLYRLNPVRSFQMSLKPGNPRGPNFISTSFISFFIIDPSI